VSRKTFRRELPADHGLIPGAAGEKHAETSARNSLEVVQVVLDPRMIGKAPDIDVPSDIVREKLGNPSGIRLRVGQVIDAGIRSDLARSGSFQVGNAHSGNGGDWGDAVRGRRNCTRARGKGQKIGPEDQPLHACQDWVRELYCRASPLAAQSGPRNFESHK